MTVKKIDITPLLDYAPLIYFMVKSIEDKDTANRVVRSEWFQGLSKKYEVEKETK